MVRRGARSGKEPQSSGRRRLSTQYTHSPRCHGRKKTAELSTASPPLQLFGIGDLAPDFCCPQSTATISAPSGTPICPESHTCLFAAAARPAPTHHVRLRKKARNPRGLRLESSAGPGKLRTWLAQIGNAQTCCRTRMPWHSSCTRRGDRAAECAGLENRCARKGTEGSNPSLSAAKPWFFPGFSRVFRISGPLLWLSVAPMQLGASRLRRCISRRAAQIESFFESRELLYWFSVKWISV